MKPILIRSGLLALSLFVVPACNRQRTFIDLSDSSTQFSAVEAGPDPADQTVDLIGSRMSRNGPVNWTAVSDQPWLTVSPTSGSIVQHQRIPLTLHVDATVQLEQWTGPTSTVGAPPTGCGAWIGDRMMIWTGDASVPATFYDPVSDTWSGAASTVGAPSSRTPTTAVWTGTELIIWGGLTSTNVPLDTGSRYNPATDTWTPMSTVGAPLARFSHVAVWTGSRMIVWGGEQPGFQYKNTGGIYDPATDTWTGATTTVNAPSPRGHLAAVWTGTRMLVWGGENPSKFATGYYYDPVSDAWTGTTTLTGAPSARSHMPGVWTGRELIIWGGGTGGPHLNDGNRYIPEMDVWTHALPLAGAPAGRASFVGTWTGSEMIVWGGEINGPLTNTGGRYRPPIPAIGSHTATVTITPDQGDPVTIQIALTVTP